MHCFFIREYTCSASAQEKFPMAIGYEYMKRYGANASEDIDEVLDMIMFSFIWSLSQYYDVGCKLTIVYFA